MGCCKACFQLFRSSGPSVGEQTQDGVSPVRGDGVPPDQQEEGWEQERFLEVRVLERGWVGEVAVSAEGGEGAERTLWAERAP